MSERLEDIEQTELTTPAKPDIALKVAPILNETVTSDNMVQKAIESNAKTVTNVKDVIDLASTQKALEKDGTVKKLTDEKTEELVNDAIRKRIEAETDKINKEVHKVRAEAEKQLAELQKSIDAKKAEAEELLMQDKKAEAFFQANKSILRCIGVRERLSLNAMIALMFPASIIFAIMQIIIFPISLVGFAIEQVMNIVDAVSGKISQAGWKIALSIVTVLAIVGVAFGGYYAFTHWILA